jgi:hypothetical protein
MGCVEGSGVPVLYIGRTVPKGFLKLTITYIFKQLPTSPTITYIVKQLHALPNNYLRHSTVTYVA